MIEIFPSTQPLDETVGKILKVKKKVTFKEVGNTISDLLEKLEAEDQIGLIDLLIEYKKELSKSLLDIRISNYENEAREQHIHAPYVPYEIQEGTQQEYLMETQINIDSIREWANGYISSSST